MGGIVRAVTKPFKGLVRTAGGLLGSIMGGGPKAPDPVVIQAPAPVVQPAAAAAPDAPVDKPDMESEGGSTTAAAGRKGKKSLTVRRTAMGSGSGLNM